MQLSLGDLNYCIALKELKRAIYDGLEMKLKVTKNYFLGWLHPLYGAMMMMNVLLCSPESSVFFAVWCGVLKGVKNVT